MRRLVRLHLAAWALCSALVLSTGCEPPLPDIHDAMAPPKRDAARPDRQATDLVGQDAGAEGDAAGLADATTVDDAGTLADAHHEGRDAQPGDIIVTDRFGPVDSAGLDHSALDAGQVDATAHLDAGPRDTTAALDVAVNWDAAVAVDAFVGADAERPDTEQHDAARPDAERPDAERPDAERPDAFVAVDTWTPDTDPGFDARVRPTSVSLTAGGGAARSSSYRLSVSLGGLVPLGESASTNYRLSLGVAR